MEAKKRQLYPHKNKPVPGDRYLAAVLICDVVGFTRLGQEDEEGTLLRLERTRAAIERNNQTRKGRVIQYSRDQAISVFPSVSNAILCASQIQKECGDPDLLPMRIGIHLGEIVEKDGSVFGEGVSIATRIESAGVADSVLVSEDVYRNVKSQGKFAFADLGKIMLRGEEEGIHMYALQADHLAVPTREHLDSLSRRRNKISASPLRKGHLIWLGVLLAILFTVYSNFNLKKQLTTAATPLVEENSMASLLIMPFDLLPGVATESPFLRNLTSDVATELDEREGISVVPRQYSRQLTKQGEVNYVQAAQLGLTHVVAGEIGRNEENVQLKISLIDVESRQEIWSQDYSRQQRELSTLKDELAEDILPNLTFEEDPFFDEIDAEPEAVIDDEAFRFFLDARSAMAGNSSKGLRRAIGLLEQSIQHDSSYAQGYAMLSECYSLLNQFESDQADLMVKAAENVGLAYRYNRSLPNAYTAHALMNLVFGLSSTDEILELCDQAIQLLPEDHLAYSIKGRAYLKDRDFARAAQYLQYAIELKPADDQLREFLAEAERAL